MAVCVCLTGVEFVVHNNFVRGWEVIDESTVRHVTTEFYETINDYERTIGKLRAISGDPMTRQVRHERIMTSYQRALAGAFAWYSNLKIRVPALLRHE